MKTLGGLQLWTDQQHLRGWRIQRHALTGHHRLLDPQNWRRGFGTREQCRTILDGIVKERGISPVSGEVIIVLHGLMRSRNSMTKMAAFLRDNADATVCNFEYASTRFQVAEHAAALGRVVDGLGSVEKVHFVGHSLGNLIVRHYLGSRYSREDAAGDTSESTSSAEPPIGRIVMLGPPNQGAELARRFARNPLFKIVWGKSGDQLAVAWEELRSELAIPRCDFGVVAGESLSNPFLSSVSDFIVRVDETKLEGQADFLVVKAIHAMLMNSKKVQTATLRFLRSGRFDAQP